MSEISGHGLMLMQHPYGNYVVQLVLEIWKEEASHEFISTIQGRVSQLCLQKFSSNVVEKALELEAIRKSIICELIDNEKISELLASQYGCYVLRTISQKCEQEFKSKMLFIVKKTTSEIYIAKLLPLWNEIIHNLS